VTAVLDGTALGRWVEIALPDAPWGRPVPFVGFVYMDWEAGMSAKGPGHRPDDPQPHGAPADRRAQPRARGRRGRRPGRRRGWRTRPSRPSTPWRRDPLMRGRWHNQFTYDLQVLVHDG
jgi:hypothetical protein